MQHSPLDIAFHVLMWLLSINQHFFLRVILKNIIHSAKYKFNEPQTLFGKYEEKGERVHGSYIEEKETKGIYALAAKK